MKKTYFFGVTLLIISALSFASCSKKAKEDATEASEVAKEDIKDSAKNTGRTLKHVVQNAKKGAQDVASDINDAAKETATDVKNAAKATASTIKNASNEAVAAVDSKLSKMSKSTRMQYDALDKEIVRIDAKIALASDVEKIKLKRTKANLVKKRDELLGK